jgi:hypothetical protein
MSDSLQCSEAFVEPALAPIRLNVRAVWPEPEYLDTSSIELDSDEIVWRIFLNTCPELLNSASELSGRTVVIDLDETLLLNSHICPDIWHIGRGYKDPTIYPAFRYSIMAKTWRGHLGRAMGRIDYDTSNVMKYPFLKNPRQIVMFRPGMLAGLRWLKAQGVQLVLVTASAQPRVNYLLKRFPLLTEVFGCYIITANDIAHHYLTTPQREQGQQDPASWQVHCQRPYSLAAKTPALVRSILDIDDYDLIVDDSNTTASLFSQSDLRHKLLWVCSDLPLGGYGLQIIVKIVARLTQVSPPELLASTPLPRLQPDLSYNCFIHSIQTHIRLEDPYYWPLCHVSDQLFIRHHLS